MIEQAVILAGGQGKRLQSYSGTTPKPIASVVGKPFLHHLFRLLASYGIKRVVLLVGHEAHQIVDAADVYSHNSLEVEWSVGDPAWQTAERLSQAIDLFDSEFLLMYSDNYFQFDLQRLEETFRRCDTAVTLNCIPRPGSHVSIEQDGSAQYMPAGSGSSGSFVELGYSIVSRERVRPYLHLAPNWSHVLEQLGAAESLSAMSSDLPYWSISDPDRLKITESFLRPKPLLLMDRDGTINLRPPVGAYVTSSDEFKFRPLAVAMMRAMAARGVGFLVASNQAGIARGYLSTVEATAIMSQMVDELVADGVRVLDDQICPHGFNDGCPCRKPSPGMLLNLAGRWQLPLVDSYFLGDDIRDVQTAIRAGCNSVYIGSDASSIERRILGQRGLVLLTGAECQSEEDVWLELADRIVQSSGELGELLQHPSP